jgi:hypothetical protein
MSDLVNDLKGSENVDKVSDWKVTCVNHVSQHMTDVDIISATIKESKGEKSEDSKE